MRVGIYYTPEADHPLSLAAAEWLGRSAFPHLPAALDGKESPADLVAEPRRYGFHATLKAPFRLAEGITLEELSAALHVFCQARTAPQLGPLQISRLGSFFALTPNGPRTELEKLAAEIVRYFNHFRAPLSVADLNRRRSAGLTPRQEELLQQFGYPYVLDEFRFHMTLTGRVPPSEHDAVMELLRGRFTPYLDTVPVLAGLALFVEPEPGAEFFVHIFSEIASD